MDREGDGISRSKRRIRVVVTKPGLDGHDRGAKIIARALRDAGMEVVYTGLHQTPQEIVETALQEDADALGLSMLSGAHMTLVPRVLDLLRERATGDVLVTVGGTIPPDDVAALKVRGVAAVFTPGDDRGRRVHPRGDPPAGKAGRMSPTEIGRGQVENRRSRRAEQREPLAGPLTHRPFAEAVRQLLGERRWSQRDLARVAGVDPAHICRLLRSTPSRVSPALLRRVAEAFDLPPDFFLEYREWCVLEAVRTHPSLRERLYRRLIGA